MTFLEGLFVTVAAVIVAGLLGVTIVLGWLIYQDVTSPTLELRKDRWECTRTERRNVTRIVGKLITHRDENVCVQFSERS